MHEHVNVCTNIEEKNCDVNIIFFFLKIVQYAFHAISVIVILSEIEMDILIQVSKRVTSYSRTIPEPKLMKSFGVYNGLRFHFSSYSSDTNENKTKTYFQQSKTFILIVLFWLIFHNQKSAVLEGKSKC